MTITKIIKMSINGSRKDTGQYSHSVATTWFMSFNVVRKNNPQAAKLFQILSFLNPDGILIDFLQSGIKAFPDDLQQVVSNRIRSVKSFN